MYFIFPERLIIMSTSKTSRPKRLSATEKQRMLVQFLKDGSVPEGFYVHEQKNGIIQFRHIRNQKSSSSSKDPLQSNEAKIKLYKQKIAELEAVNESYKSDTSKDPAKVPLPSSDYEEDNFFD